MTKICRECRRPLPTLFFYRRKGVADPLKGFVPVCIQCTAAIRKRYDVEHAGEARAAADARAKNMRFIRPLSIFRDKRTDWTA